jgi:hypothetical protein
MSRPEEKGGVNFMPFRTVRTSTRSQHFKDDPVRRQYPLFSGKGHASVVLKPIKAPRGVTHSRSNILTTRKTSLQNESSERVDTAFLHRAKLDEFQRKLELQVLIERYQCFTDNIMICFVT